MHNPQLENNFVALILLNLENYVNLQDIANKKDLIFYSPSDISTPATLKNYIQVALDGYHNNTVIPFLIYDKIKNAYAGSTRFGLINWDSKVMHIGWTWIGSEFQGSGLNKQVKFLMLEYAFEVLQFEKVEFRIDERNIRSRKAVEKVGAILEGVLRKDTLMRDGFRRSTCCYSILKEEWHPLKTSIFKDFS